MAIAQTTRAFEVGALDYVKAAVEALKTNIENRRMINRTYRELAVLSDRELADLGLHRSHIRSIAREAVLKQD